MGDAHARVRWSSAAFDYQIDRPAELHADKLAFPNIPATLAFRRERAQARTPFLRPCVPVLCELP
jgi:hypothetical protein